jgi:hypothetical protein
MTGRKTSPGYLSLRSNRFYLLCAGDVSVNEREKYSSPQGGFYSWPGQIISAHGDK